VPVVRGTPDKLLHNGHTGGLRPLRLEVDSAEPEDLADGSRRQLSSDRQIDTQPDYW
jgi:hypothetical protein